MPPKRFEGKFGIPSSHPVESLLTSALYRLPESVDIQYVEEFAHEITFRVNVRRLSEQQETLSEEDITTLKLKLARHFEDNGESAKIDIATCVDALVESPRFLQSDKGSIEKLFEIHEMKTLQKIAELRRKRAEMTGYEKNYSNPYENLFETYGGDYYVARLLNMPHLEEESTYMDHCVGTSTSYVNKIKRGEVEIFSVRDTKTHEPVVTIEYDTKSHRLLQVKAKSDNVPNLSYAFAPQLLEVLERLPETINDNGEARTIESSEVSHLTRLLGLQEKVQAREEFTRQDLLFLYEVNEPIQGFDSYDREPLIKLLRESRNLGEDLVVLADCPKESLAGTWFELTEDTQVFATYDGNRVSLCDFREADNKEKLITLIELRPTFRKEGVKKAIPDLSFEGGIISLNISPEIKERLKDWDTARKAYEQADNASRSWVQNGLNNIPWTLPTDTSLDILVLNHGITTLQDRNALVTHMDKAGYRPLTFSELVALGITRPDLNKRDEILNTLEMYSLEGKMRCPGLDGGGDERDLGADKVDVDWNEQRRFLFVRK